MIIVLLVALVLIVVAATITVVLRDDRGATAVDRAYDTRRPSL